MAQKEAHEKELSELHAALKQLKEAKAALDDELSALNTAHSELGGMHSAAAAELASTKAALARSEEARVRAEVGLPWRRRAAGPPAACSVAPGTAGCHDPNVNVLLPVVATPQLPHRPEHLRVCSSNLYPPLRGPIPAV